MERLLDVESGVLGVTLKKSLVNHLRAKTGLLATRRF